MASRVFNLDELASRIAIHLLGISPSSTVALALTCKALEVPALRALWGQRGSLGFLVVRLLSTDVWCPTFTRPADPCVLVSIVRFSRLRALSLESRMLIDHE